jgi:hypothetical protein
MKNCKPVSTLLPTAEKLSIEGGIPLGPKDNTSYRRIVGALQYLMLTRPDIAFQSTRRANSFMCRPPYIGVQSNGS